MNLNNNKLSTDSRGVSNVNANCSFAQRVSVMRFDKKKLYVGTVDSLWSMIYGYVRTTQKEF